MALTMEQRHLLFLILRLIDIKDFIKNSLKDKVRLKQKRQNKRNFLMELKIMQQYKSYIYLYQTILLRIGQQNHLQMPSNLE